MTDMSGVGYLCAALVFNHHTNRIQLNLSCTNASLHLYDFGQQNEGPYPANLTSRGRGLALAKLTKSLTFMGISKKVEV